MAEPVAPVSTQTRASSLTRSRRDASSESGGAIASATFVGSDLAGDSAGNRPSSDFDNWSLINSRSLRNSGLPNEFGSSTVVLSPCYPGVGERAQVTVPKGAGFRPKEGNPK